MRELTFTDVTVRFGSRRRGTVAVDNVNLVVPAGQVVGLVGESGSGKSTLARAAVGLAPLTAGSIRLDGRPIGELKSRPLQMIFQDPYSALDPRMSIGASIAEAMPRGFPTTPAPARPPATAAPRSLPATSASRGLSATSASRRAEVSRLLELVGLPADRAGARPDELSGGQRQRVALARALAGQPEVIVADEITSALDVSIQGAVLNVVRDLQRRMRLTMLFISHNLAVVRYVSDIVAVMRHGRIVEYGPVEQVLLNPRHEYTRELLEAVPRPGAPLGN